jgi:dTMP kinase
MLAARAQHVSEIIKPALSAGRDVVCDRFAGSTIAYQGYGRGLDPVELERMSAWAAGGLEPDVVVLLYVDAATAAARRQRRGLQDRIESEGDGFFDRVAAGFSAMAGAHPTRWQVVDGTGSVEQVAARVAAATAADDGS